MLPAEKDIFDALNAYVGRFLANAVIGSTKKKLRSLGLNPAACSNHDVFESMIPASRTFISDTAQRDDFERRLAELLGVRTLRAVDRPGPEAEIVADPSARSEIRVEREADVLEARRACRAICAAAGLSETDTVKTCTVASELARNIVQYARQGTLVVERIVHPRAGVRIVASDEGPGISNLDAILAGRHVSKRGMGRGIVGSKALMDEFDIDSNPKRGTIVEAVRYTSATR